MPAQHTYKGLGRAGPQGLGRPCCSSSFCRRPRRAPASLLFVAERYRLPPLSSTSALLPPSLADVAVKAISFDHLPDLHQRHRPLVSSPSPSPSTSSTSNTVSLSSSTAADPPRLLRSLSPSQLWPPSPLILAATGVPPQPLSVFLPTTPKPPSSLPSPPPDHHRTSLLADIASVAASFLSLPPLPQLHDKPFPMAGRARHGLAQNGLRAVPGGKFFLTGRARHDQFLFLVRRAWVVPYQARPSAHLYWWFSFFIFCFKKSRKNTEQGRSCLCWGTRNTPRSRL